MRDPLYSSLFVDQLQGQSAPPPAQADEADRQRAAGRHASHLQQGHSHLLRGRGGPLPSEDGGRDADRGDPAVPGGHSGSRSLPLLQTRLSETSDGFRR